MLLKNLEVYLNTVFRVKERSFLGVQLLFYKKHLTHNIEEQNEIKGFYR